MSLPRNGEHTMLSNTHYHLHVSGFEFTGPEVGKFIVERLQKQYISLEEADEARCQLSVQQRIVSDHVDIRRCTADCV